MSNHGVYPSVAKHYVPYQDAFGDYMQEAADGKQGKTNHHSGNAMTAQCRGDKTTQDNEIPKVAPGKKILFVPHGSTILNRCALARCCRGVFRIHLFR
jgi:hypothetical protein